MIVKTERFGTGPSPHPIRVELRNSNIVRELMKSAKKLRQTSRYGSVYLSFDRSPKERAEHKKLVQELKKKIQEDPSKHYVIRGGIVREQDPGS